MDPVLVVTGSEVSHGRRLDHEIKGGGNRPSKTVDWRVEPSKRIRTKHETTHPEQDGNRTHRKPRMGCHVNGPFEKYKTKDKPSTNTPPTLLHL